MARGSKSLVGETRVSPNGYHYTRTEVGWQLTGRLVGAEKLGRSLTSKERVRYLDNDRLNNDPDNVEVYEVAGSTAEKRRAVLLARRDEIDAELETLDEEDSDA